MFLTLYSRRGEMDRRALVKKTAIILLFLLSVTLGTGCTMQKQIREDREAAEAAMKAAEAAAARVEAAADRVEAAADRAEAAAARSERAAEKAERIFQQGLRK
jgi:sensor c-di-GMP phosphodiesterase-like protein